MTDARTIKGALCLVASAFGFAVMGLCVRLTDDYGGPVSAFQKSFFRNLVAFAIAVAMFAKVRGRVSYGTGPALKRWGVLFLRAAIGTAGIFGNFYALSHITIAESQTLNKTAPFFTVVFAWIFLKERVGWRAMGSLLLAFGGVLLIAKPGFAGEAAFPLAMMPRLERN